MLSQYEDKPHGEMLMVVPIYNFFALFAGTVPQLHGIFLRQPLMSTPNPRLH